MTITQFGLLICLGVLSCVFVAMLRVPLSRHALDIPEDRSSHTQATPRGGGCAIWIAYSIGLVVLMALDHIEMFTFIGFLGAGSFAMLSGLLDDIAEGGIRAETRLIFHAVAVVWAIAWLGGIEEIHIVGFIWKWGYAEQILLGLAMIWIINNTNFMDGLNGLAASETIFVAGMAGLLASASGDSVSLLLCTMLVATTIGFLPWNIGRAKIFLGDSGAYFLGMMIALLALTSAQTGSISPWCWTILFAVFLSDGTVTLVRRMIHNPSAWKIPHQSHACQHIRHQLDSHGKVTIAVSALNVIVLAPLATVAWRYPQWSAGIALVTLIVMAVLAVRLGSGVERNSSFSKDAA